MSKENNRHLRKVGRQGNNPYVNIPAEVAEKHDLKKDEFHKGMDTDFLDVLDGVRSII